MYSFPAPLGTSRHENDAFAILARLERTGVPARPVAFYGSSSFRQWATMAEDLGTLDAVNLGFGGGTFLSALHYLDRLLLPLRARRIVLYFGENDIANDGLSAATVFAHFLRLRSELEARAPGAEVIVLSVKHSPARWIYASEVDRLNAMIRDWCATRTDTGWIDVGSGLLGENGLPMSRLFLADLIHLNAAGYAVWAEILRATPGVLE